MNVELSRLLNYKGSLASLRSIAAITLVVLVSMSGLFAHAPIAVTLAPATSPAAAQPGITVVTLTGSNFPSGTIPADHVTLSLHVVSDHSGPAMTATCGSVTTLVGDTRRIAFQILGPNVSLPVSYEVSVAGSTSSGVSFASSNRALLTVNPPPSIVSVNPKSATQGQSLSVVITGQYTNYVQGATQATFGSGISVGGGSLGGYGPVTVTSPTTATAQLAISPGATFGSRLVTVATGKQKATSATAFSVCGTSAILSVVPNNGLQGQVGISLTITAENTHFSNGSIIDLGDGIAISKVRATDGTHLSSQLSIAGNAPPSRRAVIVTTGSEVVVLANAFLVVARPPAIITSITPNKATQGQANIPISIIGRHTQFSAASTIDLGTGVTVGNIQVVDMTHLSARITIAPNAPLGAREVTVTTGAETAILQDGFIVNPAKPALLISPNAGQQGQQSLSIAISSQAAHFVKGKTAATFGPGITVVSIVVNSPTAVVVGLNIDAAAALGPRDVILTTESKIISSPGGFTVTPHAGAIILVSPNYGQRNQQRLPIVITGQFTNFTQGASTVTFGAGITVASIGVVSSTSLTAQISIAFNAPIGTRTVTVTTGTEVVSLADAFTVVEAPALLSIVPNTGQQGQKNMAVTIRGQYTHFSQSVTRIDFGSDVVTNTITVTDATTITADISISPNASVGGHNVTVTSDEEVVTLPNGLTVLAGTPAIVAVTPSMAQQGQPNLAVKITGAFTHFTQGVTTVDFGPGLTAGEAEVSTATSLVVPLILSSTTQSIFLSGNSPAIVDLGQFSGGTTVGLTVTGAVGLLPDGTWSTNPDGSLITPPSDHTYNYVVPGQMGYPIVTAGDGLNHFAGGGANYDVGQPDSPWGLGGKHITDTTDPKAIRFGSVMGTFVANPTPLDWFLVGFGTTLTVPNSGAHLYIAINDSFYTNNTGSYSVMVSQYPAVGSHTVSVFTGTEHVSLSDGFILTPGVPAVVRTNPSSGRQGETELAISITGQFTHFVQGVTQINLGSGVVVGPAIVADATHLTAQIAIDPNASPSLRSVTVTTGTEVATLADSFAVTAGTPLITTVNPNTGEQAQANLSVSLTGQFTHWLQGTTTAAFGAGITVVSLTVNSATTATAVVNIDAAATTGVHNVTVTTGAEVVTFTGGFTVTAGAPVITRVNPNTGQQGQSNLSVSLTGQFTHWVQGTSTASFGAGITVALLTVTSPTTAIAVVNISPNAALGARDATVTTGLEAVTAANGFFVTPTPALVSASPAQVIQGTKSLVVTLTGQATHFTNSSGVDMGSGIVVSNIAASDATHISVFVDVLPEAPVGFHSVTITSGAESVTFSGFSVVPFSEWTQLPISGGVPTGYRHHQATVRDPLSDRLIMFGGALDTPGIVLVNDLWIQTGATGTSSSTWQQIVPAGQKPPSMWLHRAVYDQTTNRMIIVGGALGFTPPPNPDVWILDNANGLTGTPTWSKLPTTGGFPGRINPGAAYDHVNNRIILYGGTDGSQDLNETWVLTNANGTGGPAVWSRLSPTGTLPVASHAPTLVYDHTLNRALLFGGAGPGVWALSNANGLNGTPTWSRLPTSQAEPPSRYEHWTFLDESTDTLVVFGGLTTSSPSVALNDTWILRQTRSSSPEWQLLDTTSVKPEPRCCAMGPAYDASSRRMVLYGGSDLSDTWNLTNATGVLNTGGTISLSAVSAQPGQTLQINITGIGTRFGNGSTGITFGDGILTTSISVNSPTALTANLRVNSDAQTGPRDVTVVFGRELAVLRAGFTVQAAGSTPSLTSLVPNSGAQGQSVSVSVTGLNTHFTGASTIDLGPSVTVSSLVSTDATHFTALVTIAPNAAIGPRDAVVTTGDEIVRANSAFTITAGVPLPSLLSVSPTAGPQGQGGPLVIAGLNTHFLQGTSVVDLGPGITVGTITVSSATSLTAQVTITETAATGSRNVTVTTGTEVATLANGFTVQPGTPILTSMVPASGRQGQSVSITFGGKYTHWAQGTTTVSLGSGITINSVTVASATSLTAQVTIDLAATVGTRTPVITTGSEVVSVADIFSVQAGLISASPSPAAGQQAQSLPVTITGQFTHFVQGTTQVSFGADITVGSVTVASATSLTAQVTIAENAATGPRTVIVTTGTEIVTAPNAFTVNPGPVILSLDPGGAYQNQTVSVAITGQLTNFIQGTTKATFGAGIAVGGAAEGALGPVTVTSATTATAQVVVNPAATPGPRTVSVQTGNEVASFTNGFSVVAPFVITSITPNHAVVGQQNLTVAVVGQNTHFVQGTSALDMAGNGVSVASVTVTDATHLSAVINVAANAVIAVRDVAVTTGTEFALLKAGFTVTGPPAISSITPNTGQPGQSNVAVTIVGQNTHFTNASAIDIGTGITFSGVSAADATHLSATMAIAATAALGLRNITVTSGTEVATLANGFGVNASANQAPVITIVPTWSVTLPARLTITYTVTDDGLPSGGALTVSWDTISAPTNGTAGYTDQTLTSISVGFSQAGTYVLRLTASDTQYSVTKDVTVTVTGTPIAAPTVSIATPTEGQEIPSPLDVTGTVNSQSLTSWSLEYRMSEDSSYQTLTTGTTNVANAKLGTFDPTLLLNGMAYLHVKATDSVGQTSISPDVGVVLTKNMKVGNFTVSFNDLSVPVAGLPIQIVRTYDSRRRAIPGNDFSYGWALDVRTAQMAESVALGDQWNESHASGLAPYCIDPVKAHTLTATLPDGTTYQFQPTLAPHCQSFSPILQVAVGFTPIGTTPPNASLAIAGNNTVAVNGTLGGVTFLDAETLGVFDPDQYILTLPDGRAMQISLQAGLQKMTDLNGNTLTVTPAGITHSSGKSVTFTRNAAQRITQITDPIGNSITYAYNLVTGDMASVTDQSNQTTTFTYDADHGLLTIKDPRGVQPIRNVYDDTGRLIQHVDAFGNTINYTHDIGTHQEIVTDRLGNVTVNEYDTDGNVVKVTDALGDITQRTYDSRDNLLSETNALGKTRSYTYDQNNNRLTETDPLGNTATYTYNSRNQVLTITDALNRVTTNVYDANGNLLSTKDPAGNLTTYTYNAQGLRATMTDPLNGVTSYQYDASGNLTQQTDVLHHVISYTYDANGNKLSQTQTRTTSSGTETLVTSYQYDAQNRLIKTTYPDGSTMQIAYNAIGKQSTTTDQLSRQTGYQYDLMGRLVQTTYPDGTSESQSYDAEGDRVTSTDRAGRTTTYVYDALKRLTQTVYPDNAATTTGYDAIGEVTSVKDSRGNITQYQYDAGGRRTKVTDALNHATSFGYDPVGNQVSMTDANGNTTQYQYDGDSRRTKVIYPDGTFDTTAYDGLGRTISKTDQAGKTTQFAYDAVGRLTQVTDALGQPTKYGYDEVGNRITQTDANNHTTTFAYDKLGRRTQRTLPLGMKETSTYDLIGNLKTKTDFNGKTTTYAYDAMNRLISKTPDASFGQAPVSFTYTAIGQRQSMVDASGTSTYAYDLRDRLTQKVTPQGTLSYSYDAAGNLLSIRSSNANGTSVNYAYDALNRLVTVIDNRLAAGTMSYTYDNSGNLSAYLYPNGVQTTYQYSTLNRLTNVSVAKGATVASYAYTLGPTGSRTGVTELGGRQVGYTYDALYRLTQETITGGPTLNGTIGYQYDPVGNRLQRTSSVTPVPAATYAYDANDRLTTDSYDANGNTTAAGGNIYGYDFEDRLNLQNNGAVAIVYDGDGNRAAKTASGTTTQYLVDDRNLTGYAQVLEELTSGTVQRVYTYGLNRISQSQSSGTSFYGYDGHGNVRLLTDTTGAVTDRYDYDAFGNIISQAGSTSNVYLYSGEQNDPDLNLYYLRARYLSQSSGRFWNMDTAEGDPGSPVSLHKYLYGGGNPVDRTDPTGLAFDLPSTVLASTIAGALQGSIVGYISGGTEGSIKGLVQGAVFGAVFPLGGAAIGTALLGNAARGVFLTGVGGLIGSAGISTFYAITGPAPVRNVALTQLFSTVAFMYFSPRALQALNTTTTQAEVVNASYSSAGYRPPWAPGTVVAETTLFAPKTYVRVYSQGNTSPIGAWVADPAEVVGLTPEQVQSVLSLPYRPDHLTMVNIPAGTTIRTGFANPGAFGGDGYGFQGQLMTTVPSSAYGPGTPLP